MYSNHQHSDILFEIYVYLPLTHVELIPRYSGHLQYCKERKKPLPPHIYPSLYSPANFRLQAAVPAHPPHRYTNLTQCTSIFSRLTLSLFLSNTSFHFINRSWRSTSLSATTARSSIATSGECASYLAPISPALPWKPIFLSPPFLFEVHLHI